MNLAMTAVQSAVTLTSSGPAPSSDGLGGLAGWAVDVTTAFGPVGVGFLVAVENLFPPIPSEVILPVAGYAAGAGQMSVWAAWLAATIGSVLGALALYWIGTLVGHQRLAAIADRIPLMSAHDVDRGVEWFERYGPVSVLFGRCVPLVRSAISVPAGVVRMPMRTFLPFTFVGSAVWNALFVGAGFQLGARWQQVEQYSAPLNNFVLLAMAAIGLLWLTLRLINLTPISGGSRSNRPRRPRH